MISTLRELRLVFLALAFLVALPLTAALADNAWGRNHWERPDANDVTVKLGSNVSGSWVSALDGASADWRLQPVPTHIGTQVVDGAGNAGCGPVLDRVEVCNAAYGQNGWLGLASIWVYRGKDAHIAQGTVQLNDTYFDTAAYNTSTWRNYVTCQEVGHTIALAHQDEDFDNANLGTCMDYTAVPDASNEHPNLHDYEQLGIIYAHDHAPKAGGGSGGGGNGGNGRNNRAEAFFGQTALPANASAAAGDVFTRDLPNGLRVITFVTWLPE